MNYKGLKILDQNGYPSVNLPDHPLSATNGRVYLHRLVYWEHYGDIPDGYHVHHIDENRWNWNIDNLQLLSRSEHGSLHHRNEAKIENCRVCDAEVEIRGTRRKNYENVFCSLKCRYAFLKKDKYKWPSREEVLRLVEETNYTQAAKVLGISDNAIRKFLKRTANT